MTGIKRLLVPKILFASLLLSGLLLPMSSSAAVRDTISINQGWQFHRGDVKNMAELITTQSGDDVVNLPHDFLIGQDWVAPDASERPDNRDAASNVRSRLSSRGFKEMGIGWYRYQLTPKDEWKGKRIVLDFQGIMLVGDVYLNGKRIGGADYGYLGFDIDLSKLLKWGQVNEITVKADTGKPNNSRWFTGGGLFRDVNLIVTDKNLYFPRHPLFIRTVNNKEIKIRANILNQQKTKKPQIPVEVKILDAEGKVVARHQIETTGEVVALKLVPDMETWHADGKDLMHVRIYAVDKKGRRVMNVKDAKAFDKLTFTVKGDANIIAVDNGNITSDELHIGKTQLEKTIQRHLYQGSALVILRSGDKPGKIELSVAGEKMKAKKLVLNTK